MVRVINTFKDVEEQNQKISEIIDKTIKEYGAEGSMFLDKTWQYNSHNYVYSGKQMIFSGKLEEGDYNRGTAQFYLKDMKYFKWAIDVAQKVEANLGLEVILDTYHDTSLDK